MSYPHPHPDPNVVEWADWLPYNWDEVPDHLIDLWSAAWAHDGTIDAIMYGEWPCCRELTTGCTCRDAPRWYPGRPGNPDCPIHGHPLPPVPSCTCRYRVHTTSVVATVRRRPVRQRLVTGTGFDVDPGCVHHGDLRRVEYFDATYLDVLDEQERKGD